MQIFTFIFKDPNYETCRVIPGTLHCLKITQNLKAGKTKLAEERANMAVKKVISTEKKWFLKLDVGLRAEYFLFELYIEKF